MDDADPHSPPGRLAYVLGWVFPNLPAALLALGGFCVESILILFSPEPVFKAGIVPALFAVLFLAWFWMSVALIAWQAARLCVAAGQRWGRSAAWTLRLLFALVAIGIMWTGVSSWGLFLNSGRFANVEALLFLLQNPPQTTWLYLAWGERAAVTGLAAISVFLLFVIPVYLKSLGHATWEFQAPATPNQRKMSAWGVATIVVLTGWLWITGDSSPQRRATRIDAVMNGLNPAVALASSGVDMLRDEPITPCLDVAELEPWLDDVWQPPAANDGNRPPIIIIAIESLRADVVGLVHQGREVMPNLNRLAAGSLNLTRSYAQSTHSDYSDVCIPSSLYPLRTRRHHYYRKDDPWPKTLIYDLLAPAGYATAIISSQNESWGCMDQFLETPGLDLFYDAKRSDAETYVSERDPGFAHEIRVGTFSKGCLYDNHTMDVAVDWVKGNVADDRPFFLSMNFQASHFPYELPPGCAHPFQPCQLDADISFMSYPEEKTPFVRNAYYNALHECDRQLGRMVETLRSLGKLDEAILVVLGENGEAFHENGSVGHAREPVEPAVHVATVIHAPKYVAAGALDYPFEHVDLVPTLFGMIDWPTHPNFQGIDILADDRPPLDERLIFFHVLSPAAQADAVTLAGRWKYIYSHDQDRGWLFDLDADPQESDDLTDVQPDLAANLHNVLMRWRQRQLAYYHYPMYYQNYFPPNAPRWSPPPEKGHWATIQVGPQTQN